MAIHSERATGWWEENTENVAEIASPPIVHIVSAILGHQSHLENIFPLPRPLVMQLLITSHIT